MSRPPPMTSYIDFGTDGVDVETLAELEGCSPSRIRAILAKAIAKCRREAEKRGLKLEDLFGQMGQ